MKTNPHIALKSQSGMVLLICLMFLTALTLLGLSVSADAILQHQLAANLQDNERAKQSAQAGLLWAEHWLKELEGMAPDTCSQSCEGFSVYAPGTLKPHPEHEDFPWWQKYGLEAGIDPTTGVRLSTVGSLGVNPPMWVIEELYQAPLADNSSVQKAWYRILSRGSGKAETTVSVVESVVSKTWPDSSGNDSDDPAGLTDGRVSWRELR